MDASFLCFFGSMTFGFFGKAFLLQRAYAFWMTCCLLPGCVASLEAPVCYLQKTTISGFSRDGDILIGGMFPVHDARMYGAITFKEKPASSTCEMLVPENFRWLQAMAFAIEEINKNPNLLPNITLGFRIHDSCMIIKRSLEGILWMLTGQEEPIPNYQCWRNHPPAAFIGDATSTRSIIMAQILGLYRYPQISYAASSPLLSDRNQFPSFFRTIPSDDYQSRGLAQLVLHFGWTWVGLLADDDDYGQQGIRLLQQELARAGACVAFSENILTSRADKNAFHIVQVIKHSTANAIIIFSSDLMMIVDEMMRQNVTGKICVATDGWSTSARLSVEKYSEILTGTIGFAIHSGRMPGFEKYLISLQPTSTPDPMFLQELWEESYGCRFQHGPGISLNVLHNDTELCPEPEKLEKLQLNPSSDTTFGFPYKIYSAVYAIALSIQDLSICMPQSGPFQRGSCADIRKFQPWQLLHYIKKVHLQEKVGTGPFFDDHGNPPAQYDIINWQRSTHGTLRQVKVGSYDSSAPPGETLIINASTIRWIAGGPQVPASVCSPSCPSGSRKLAREGEPICCFMCLPCPQGEISNETDSDECSRCPWDQWPNQNQDHCIPKIIEFLDYTKALGAMLAATSILSSSIPVFILALFVLYRNSPIVKANNINISYVLLLSLTLCFLCSMTFIGYPTPEKCLLRQVAFGVTFALCISCIMSKTIMVVIAFNATKPNSDLKRWVTPNLSYMLIVVCSLIQVLLCVSWTIISPPFTQYNIVSTTGKLIVECNEGSPIAFWCMLGYLGVLATVSFIVAFLARKLPDSFNEAKFITFSMLAFLSVWISFIPAYLSTKGKYMVAMEIFAILSSSISLVSCIFFPKCYIILFKSEMNTKEYLMGRGTGLRNVKRI